MASNCPVLRHNLKGKLHQVRIAKHSVMLNRADQILHWEETRESLVYYDKSLDECISKYIN